MFMESVKKAESLGCQGLIDVVFSWSIADVLNKDLYKGKVMEIPKTFSSTNEYMTSFKYPLMEETRANLVSSMDALSRAQTCEILAVEKSLLSAKDWFYNFSLKTNRYIGSSSEGLYEPECGDLIAFTEVLRPRHISDLDKPKRPYTVAVVEGRCNDNPDKFRIRSSKPIVFSPHMTKYKGRETERLFAVYLTNMITNIRIWKALNSELEGQNLNVIEKLLRPNSNLQGGAECTQCLSEGSNTGAVSRARDAISSFGLDESQKAAVLGCVATKACLHQSSVKLIWGPPGTGKTRTVASLLFTLLEMECRTLTCAPTNIAVLGVTARLVSLVRNALEFDTFGLGDIVLFGNGERMKIDDHDGVHDVFLDYRVRSLAVCSSGWRNGVESMTQLLEHPEERYRSYLEKLKKNEEEEEARNGSVNGSKDGEDELLGKDLKKKITMGTLVQILKENKDKEKQEKMKNQKKCENKDDRNQKRKEKIEMEKDGDHLLTFDEFVYREFNIIGNQLTACITNLYTNLPTRFISVGVVRKMIRLNGLLESVRRAKDLMRLSLDKAECLEILKSLPGTFSVPNFVDNFAIQSFCLQHARLIFCTASSSSKLHTEGMTPVELLVIDEAAQLKECESAIPLQLSGLRHAMLIGDEKQLPAMVQSEICKNAEFGRSLFERLVLLEYKKHLLNVQYRMHPAISSFPNKEFYDERILDAPNVKEKTYEKHILDGKIYGSFSFINVTEGKEDFIQGRSPKNLVEVAVLVEIITSLHKECVARKQKVRVGCISPYKGQVYAIQEKLGTTYSTDAESDFSVNVRSVDGFQGGEEDIIIISTVRCNESGSIGFLSDPQRANVALTRARHCLWILGSGSTLINNGSVWAKLVVDAKSRGCFYIANKEKNLARAMIGALVELKQLFLLLDVNSLVFREARWKVCFSDDFLTTMDRIMDREIRVEVLTLLSELSNGWRPPQKDGELDEINGTSSKLLEQCEVNETLRLIWTVEILRENSNYIQVLKVWDIQPLSGIPELTKRLDRLLGTYTVDTLSRCISKRVEGDLVIPMTWPAEPDSGGDVDLVNRLQRQLASLRLSDGPASSVTNYRSRMKYRMNGGAGTIDKPRW